MLKIKDIIEKIQVKGTEYNDLSFRVAKQVWLIVASLYYLAYLFTVGGFYFGPITLDNLSLITFHTFSVLVVATAWFFYEFSEYQITINFPTHRWIAPVAIFIGFIFTVFSLIAHLGLI